MRGTLNKFGVIILFVLMVAFSVNAANVTEIMNPEAKQILNDEGSTKAGYAGPFHFPYELDEQIGDTLSVGYTWRDMQHNGTIGQMIGVGFDPDNDDAMVIHMIWTGREGPQDVSEARYNKVFFDENGDPFFDQEQYANGRRIDSGGTTGFGAYTVLYADKETNMPFVAYHGQRNATASTESYIGAEATFMDYFFNPTYALPNFTGAEGSWPHMATEEYNGVRYLHTVVMPGTDAPFDQSIFYARSSYINGVIADASPGGGVQQVTDKAMNLSGNVAVSRDGSKVTVAQTVSRWLQRGSIPAGWDGLALSQSDNDIYLWTSDDGGETWDWENPFNLTDFYAPNPSYLPDDTTSANTDTLRAYTEVEMSYDADDVLHVIFQIHQLDYYRESVYRSGRVYYWNDQDRTFSMVGDGSFWNGATERSWEKLATHGSVQKDADGILWALWQQSGEDGDTIIRNDTIFVVDASDDGCANTDLYVAASADNGKRWTKGINITNTRNMNPRLQPGESRSEIEPSLAPYVDGDYLHISYTLDFDPGVCVPSGDDDVGEPTKNQQVYQRVSKTELKNLFTEYLPNYPLHIDSVNCYIDDSNWEWDNPFASAIGGDDSGEALTPDQFELKQNYPNPFNPSTKIEFSLYAAGNVKLAVFDVLGREVATLVNRNMSAGTHGITFLADELPSGVYFYKLTSGESSKVQKMVLMK